MSVFTGKNSVKTIAILRVCAALSIMLVVSSFFSSVMIASADEDTQGLMRFPLLAQVLSGDALDSREQSKATSQNETIIEDDAVPMAAPSSDASGRSETDNDTAETIGRLLASAVEDNAADTTQVASVNEASAVAPVTDTVPAPVVSAPVVAPAPAPAPASTPAPAPAPAPSPRQLSARSIEIGGVVLPYGYTPYASTAPESGAALWCGNDSTTDGSYGYFIGHNPGDFTPVYYMTIGDMVRVCDASGNTRTYTAVHMRDVSNTTYWENIQAELTAYGESVILQTCIGDGSFYRIVVCV